MNSPFTRGRPRVWREGEPLSLFPNQWGAYRFSSDKEVAYIGITSNLYNRINWHRSTNRYYNPSCHKIEYQIAADGISWDDLREWEKRKIAQHSPNLVTYVGGNGRRPAVHKNGQVIEILQNESIEDVLVKISAI